MSVYIKGIEMPTSCRACHLKMNCDDCEGWECICVPLHQQIGYLDDLLTDKRRDDCPLVPVPEHGRLIDADAFSAKILEIVERQKYDDLYAQSFSVGAILREVANELKGVGLDGYANAPTIIPAEEGE